MATINFPLKAFLFAAFVFIPFLPVSAEACSCSASFTPWLAELSNSNAVFVAKVRSVVKVDPNDDRYSFFGPDRRVTFEIEKVYKGIDASTRLVSMYADYEASSCSFAVDDRQGPRVGERWIVFAIKMNAPADMFFGGSCNKSSSIDSTEQLNAIESGLSKITTRQGIIGAVVLKHSKLANDVEVEVAGEGVKRTSKVDADGYYWFSMNKPGNYTVTVRLPFAPSLMDAYIPPETVEESPSVTTIIYKVQLSDGIFHYNEFNVFDPG